MLVLCCLVVLWFPVPALAETQPVEITAYRIDATYDPESHIISAQETASYVNTTGDPMPDIVMHLYLNAFSSTETLWMRESNSGMRGFQFDPTSPGWMRIASIRMTGGTSLDFEALDVDTTLIRITLPEPIEPGAAVSLDIEFEAALPRVFARTGWADRGNFVIAGQWFPKFGVWQQGNWNAYPFHANSEFFADFGSYDVSLTVPGDWVIGASAPDSGEVTPNADGTATHHYHAEHIIDFVWSASPRYREIHRWQDDIHVRVLFYPAQRATARRALNAALDGLRFYEAWIGPYGGDLYQQLTIIIVPPDAGGAGGMEYPTLFTVGSLAPGGTPHCLRLTEAETLHELAHQWFQSVIATNEAEEPWLDEGFADYATTRALDTLYDGAISTCGNWNLTYQALQRASYVLMPDITMAGKAWDFGMEYSIATYAKPVVGLTTLQNLVGEETMTGFLKAYYDQHAFTHPTADDAQRVMSTSVGEAMSTWFFDSLVNNDSVMDATVAAYGNDYIQLERTGELCTPTEVALLSRPNILGQPEASTITWDC
ncbi:MAG: M1 family metallopeptidase, partial [Anaerolineae bacterium]|nr:M1 family metallopeptidase [Anaerolineae bacterium]